MASWTSSIFSSLSLLASSAKGSGGDVYSWLQPLVNILSSMLSRYWIENHSWSFSGMFIFWTLQTACFALYSTTGNTHAAHTVIAMICTSTLCPSLVMTLIFCCTIESLVLRFLWVHFGILFFLSTHTDIKFADDVRIFKWSVKLYNLIP